MKRQQNSLIEQDELNEIRKKTFKCLACNKYAKFPVLTQCGHMFCWQCLYEATKINSSCPECKQPYETAKCYPVYTDHHEQQQATHQQQEQPSSQNQLSSHEVVPQSSQQVKELPPRPVAKHRQRILNPNMIGAGMPLASNNLPSNVNAGVLLAGHVFISPLGVNTFNDIQEGLQNDEDYEQGQKFKIKMHITIILTILVLVYFLFI